MVAGLWLSLEMHVQPYENRNVKRCVDGAALAPVCHIQRFYTRISVAFHHNGILLIPVRTRDEPCVWDALEDSKETQMHAQTRARKQKEESVSEFGREEPASEPRRASKRRKKESDGVRW